MSKIKKILIGKTIYQVIDTDHNRVCILQTFGYADGYKRQLKTWVENYKEVTYDDGGYTKIKIKE